MENKKMTTKAITFPSLSVCCILLLLGFMEFVVAEETAPQSASPPPPSPTPPPPPMGQSNFAPFRPSIAVIIGVLTTLFSVTFLILLYAKHCKRSAGVGRPGNPSYAYGVPPSSFRRNSGVDRKVIESLPVFRFASLRGPKDGLECAVCLNRFEPTEILRLLPKCKHAFHVECVDTWLESHSTCPLCRYRVDPEDVLLVIEEVLDPAAAPAPGAPPPPVPAKQEDEVPATTARVSGRHSSAGEKSSRSYIVPTAGSSSLSRISADGGLGKKRIVEAVRSVGCFDRGAGAIRKDVLLLPDAAVSDRESLERRLSHRIVVSDTPSLEGRWSETKSVDLLFLRSEMIIDSGRYSFGPSDPSRRSVVSASDNHQVPELRLEVASDAVSGRDSGRYSVDQSDLSREAIGSVTEEIPAREAPLDTVEDAVSGRDNDRYRFDPSDLRSDIVMSVAEARPTPEGHRNIQNYGVSGRFSSKRSLINSPNPRSVSEIRGLARLPGQPSVCNKWQNRFSIS